MNRKLILLFAILLVLAILIADKTLTLKEKVLPDGKMTQEQLSPDKIDSLPSILDTRPQVEISTSKGILLVELRPDLSPKSVGYFLSQWNSGICDKLSFHRVEDWVVQGCDPNGNGTGGLNNLPTEVSSASFTAGSVGVARTPLSKDLSNNSQFFILKKDATSLNREYTYLGKVLTGMDIVNQLQSGDQILSISLLSK